jgi:hypothetical protein
MCMLSAVCYSRAREPNAPSESATSQSEPVSRFAKGEDVGARQAERPLVKSFKPVAQRMQSAATALSNHDLSGRASKSQTEAVTGLDALIADLRTRCEKLGGQCSKPSASQSQSHASRPPGAAPGETAATSTAPGTSAADRSAISNLVKGLWGHLPERQRDELLQPLSEEFLPEYAAEIEEYFRVLAASPQNESAEKKP